MSNTLTGYDELLLRELGDDTTTPAIYTDSELRQSWILAAVRYASTIQPRYLTTTITTLENTYRYDAPANALSINKITYKHTSPYVNEVNVSFTYEPFDNKINIIDASIGWPFQAGSVLTVYYTKKVTEPTTTVNTEFDELYDRAIVLYACSYAIQWMTRKLIGSSSGVLDFVRGRYEEKSGQSFKSMSDLRKEMVKEADDLLSGNGGFVVMTSGNPYGNNTALDPVDGIMTEHGWAGVQGRPRLAIP